MLGVARMNIVDKLQVFVMKTLNYSQTQVSLQEHKPPIKLFVRREVSEFVCIHTVYMCTPLYCTQASQGKKMLDLLLYQMRIESSPGFVLDN